VYHKVTNVIQIFEEESGCLFNGQIVGFVHAFWYKPCSVLMPQETGPSVAAVPELVETVRKGITTDNKRLVAWATLAALAGVKFSGSPTFVPESHCRGD
jgi:hypothetical protein